MDCASSEFYNSEKGLYELKGEGKSFTSHEFTDYLANLVMSTQLYQLKMVRMSLIGMALNTRLKS